MIFHLRYRMMDDGDRIKKYPHALINTHTVTITITIRFVDHGHRRFTNVCSEIHLFKVSLSAIL